MGQPYVTRAWSERRVQTIPSQKNPGSKSGPRNVPIHIINIYYNPYIFKRKVQNGKLVMKHTCCQEVGAKSSPFQKNPKSEAVFGEFCMHEHKCVCPPGSRSNSKARAGSPRALPCNNVENIDLSGTKARAGIIRALPCSNVET